MDGVPDTERCSLTSYLSMIIAIAFRLANFHPMARAVDPTLVDSLFSVWTQAELNYSLASATIPGLRPFAKTMNTQFGAIGERESTRSYGYSMDGSNRIPSYQMSNLKGSMLRESSHEEVDTAPESNPNFTGKLSTLYE